MTLLEGLLARGDRRVGRTILKAYENGALYDAWSETFHYDIWLKAMEETGISYDFYNFRTRTFDEILPWDFIHIGVTRKFLATGMGESKTGYRDTQLPPGLLRLRRKILRRRCML